jgi:hypothetical protein
VSRETDDALRRVGGKTAALEDLRNRPHDRADRGPSVGLHHDLFARAWRGGRRPVAMYERLGAADRGQLHRHEADRRDRIHSSLYIRNGRREGMRRCL